MVDDTKWFESAFGSTRYVTPRIELDTGCELPDGTVYYGSMKVHRIRLCGPCASDANAQRLVEKRAVQALRDIADELERALAREADTSRHVSGK